VRLFLPGWSTSADVWAPFASSGDELGGAIEPGMDVVAWSLGAMRALDAATRIPLASLTLVAASPQFVRGDGYRHGWRSSALLRMRERLEVDTEAVIDDFQSLLFAPGEARSAPPREHDRRVLEEGLRFLERYSLHGREHEVHCPVRLLHGELDALCPLAAAELLAEALPQAELTVVAGAGHALPLSHPDEVGRWLGG
jgi:pimeloyl-[acyl-carrier protein] methyl ester esterase